MHLICIDNAHLMYMPRVLFEMAYVKSLQELNQKFLCLDLQVIPSRVKVIADG